MIRRIGIIYQGPNDKGLLMGIRDRLGCGAELIEPRIRGRTQKSTWKTCRKNWERFQRQGVDLVVRLTDADGDRWQEVKREEQSAFPDEARAILVCGVTKGAVEAWLALDRHYLEEKLGIPAAEDLSESEIIGRIKSAMSQQHSEDYDQALRYMVCEASPEVFQKWLAERSFREFYADCRNAALREGDCSINDELRDSSSS
jgi:hypothetical protein